jgi:hypothetical protein
MGLEKFRRRAIFRGSVLVTGSLQVDGPIIANSGFNFQGQQTIKSTSAAAQFAGMATINSGAATVVISTTAVHSNSLIFTGAPKLSGATAAVTTSLGITSVVTITDGGFFVLGWANGGNVAGQTVDVPWMIVLAG